MKKTLLTALFLCIVILTYGSISKEKEIPIPYDSTSNKYAYMGVVEVDSSSEFLYRNAKKWLIDKYLNENFGLDKTNDKLIQRGTFDIISTIKGGMVSIPYNFTVNFNIILEFKEGRYRYIITNIKLSQNAEGTTSEQSLENFVASSEEMGMGRKMMGEFIVQTCNIIDDEFTLLISEMTKSLNENQKQDADW